jgi:endonuclease I
MSPDIVTQRRTLIISGKLTHEISSKIRISARKHKSQAQLKNLRFFPSSEGKCGEERTPTTSKSILMNEICSCSERKPNNHSEIQFARQILKGAIILYYFQREQRYPLILRLQKKKETTYKFWNRF